MAERTLMSFDWAIKKVLRHQENFEVLEGFLSELRGFDVWIQNILESEGNTQTENDKWDRVDILVQTRSRNYPKKKYGIQTVADIFPKYYILRVGSFKEEKPVEPIDEWFYFLKKSEIKDSFKAKGMKRAKAVLDVERMNIEERRAYQRHIENRRIENSVIETAEYKTARRRNIEVAKELLLLKQLPISMIAQVSKLSEEEVTLLSEGKALDMDTDNED